MSLASREVLISNQRGLHARASAKFVNLAADLGCPIEVEKDGNKVTGDRERYARNNAVVEAAPDLGLGSATYRWLWEAFRSMERLWRADYAQSVQVPILFAIAGEDRVAQSRAIEDFALRLKLARHIVIPHARHEILQERDELRQQFWAAFDAYVGAS